MGSRITAVQAPNTYADSRVRIPPVPAAQNATMQPRMQASPPT